MLETIPRLRYGPDDIGVKLSAEEFARAEFQKPFRYERVKGRLVVMTPSGDGHRSVVNPVLRDLMHYWKEHPGIVADVDAEGWVATSPDDDRIPDIVVYLNKGGVKPTRPETVPDLVFEFVSESRADQERDYIDKREEYERIGVKQYVIVDRLKNSTLVLLLSHRKFTERQLARTDVFTTPLLPGFSLALCEILVD